jgi:hypothetical protein
MHVSTGICRDGRLAIATAKRRLPCQRQGETLHWLEGQRRIFMPAGRLLHVCLSVASVSVNVFHILLAASRHDVTITPFCHFYMIMFSLPTRPWRRRVCGVIGGRG